MKEVYTSYDGLLDVDHQSKYTIFESDNFYQIETKSVWTDKEDQYIRISKSLLKESDFNNIEKISEIWQDIENGCYNDPNCQIMYKNKWYSGTTINKIQNDKKDYRWHLYV